MPTATAGTPEQTTRLSGSQVRHRFVDHSAAAEVVTLGRPRLAGAPTPEDLARKVLEALGDNTIPALLSQIEGSFVVAAAMGDSWLIAADRFGAFPLFYCRHAGGVDFSTDIYDLAKSPNVEGELNPQSIFNFLYFHVIPSPLTIYTGIEKLGPAEFLAGSGTRVQHAVYWLPPSNAAIDGNESTLATGMKDHLRHAVQTQACTDKVGAFLSGGLDSSTVAGLLQQAKGEQSAAFSIGFDAEGYDEMEFARTSARHFGMRHFEYYVTPQDVMDALPRLPRAFNGPFGNASAIPTFYCSQLAKSHGYDLLLAGDGGDEIFGGNARYAKQLLFQKYYAAPGVLRHGLFEPAAKIIGGLPRIPLVSKVASYINQAAVPMPDRMETYNLLERLGADAMLAPALLQRVRTQGPIEHLRKIYENYQDEALINRMLGYDMRLTLADNDLPKVTQMTQLAGVEVAYPMLDNALVDFAFKLPPGLKVKSGQLRYFYKRAVADFLPSDTIAKEKHGFGLPFGIWLAQYPPLRELAGDMLASLESRAILRDGYANYLRQAVDEHPPYYGTMVWVLITLELWLREFAPDYTLRGA